MEKKKIIALGTLSAIGAVVGYMFQKSYQLGLCYADELTNTFDVSCHRLFERIGDPLAYGMSALVLVFATLVLVPRAYEAWKKFAVWAIPLTALLFILAPEQSSGLGVVAFGPTPEQVFKWGSVLFVVVSLVIIARAGLRKQ